MIDRPKTEAEYQAEWDARTLADAERIKMDEERNKKALAAAKRIAAEQDKEAMAMQKIAGREQKIDNKPRKEEPKNYINGPMGNGKSPDGSFWSGKSVAGNSNGVTTII